eukprot:6200795-Pleurochrysis_carterae.AAC.2
MLRRVAEPPFLKALPGNGVVSISLVLLSKHIITSAVLAHTMVDISQSEEGMRDGRSRAEHACY